MALAVGVDVGGTKIAAGVVDDAGTILASERRPTPSHRSDDVADLIGDLVGALRARYPEANAVGVGAAGWVDATRSTVLFAPNLAWRDEPLRDVVAERVGLRVVVENDANAMAWAEYRFGAGRGCPDLVCLTVGTGIGCGIVLDGRLYRGHSGLAAEPGHMQVVPGGHRCGCGNRGCWEQYCSGRALVREARELATVAPAFAARLLELGDGVPEGITGPEVTQAAQEGDEAALTCFASVGRWLGQGMADLAAVLDPGRYVIGGGVSEAGDLLLEPARAAFAESLSGRTHRPHADVVVAELGNAAGVVGAADLARAG